MDRNAHNHRLPLVLFHLLRANFSVFVARIKVMRRPSLMRNPNQTILDTTSGLKIAAAKVMFVVTVKIAQRSSDISRHRRNRKTESWLYRLSIQTKYKLTSNENCHNMRLIRFYVAIMRMTKNKNLYSLRLMAALMCVCLCVHSIVCHSAGHIEAKKLIISFI